MGAMIKWCMVLVALLCLATSAEAATMKLPSLTAGSVTYSNVVVLGANATDLYFTHDQGIGNVKLKYLSPSLQKQFHFEPRAAAEEERKQAEADVLYHSIVASNIAAQVEKTRAAATNQGPDSLADPISDKSLLGKPAPKLEFDKWVGEKPATEGKYVLLAFWAPWSKPSCQAVADLNALRKKFADKLAVIGIQTGPDAESANAADAKPDFAFAADETLKLAGAAGITSIPSVILVDTKGIVRYQGHPAALTEKKLQAVLSAPE
jgi:hypothetical protein